MENFGWKGLFVTLYQRVVLSYKSTLIAIALAGGDALLSYLGNVNLPSWAHSLVGLVAAGFALYKGAESIQQSPVTLAKGFSRLSILAIMSATLLSTSAGCAWFKANAKVIGADILDCEKQEIKASIPCVSPSVAGFVNTGILDKSALEGCALANLEDVVVCAYREYVSQHSIVP
jgi:hypothetical protein